jgi:hypothetical protein
MKRKSSFLEGEKGWLVVGSGLKSMRTGQGEIQLIAFTYRLR